MRTLANELAPRRIRVNAVCPFNVDTPMIQNETTYRLFMPDLDDPTREDFGEGAAAMTPLGMPWVLAVDVSNAILWLASDEARYVTGVALPVEAGLVVK